MTVYARPGSAPSLTIIPPGRLLTKTATKSTPHNTKPSPSPDRVRARGTQDRLRAREHSGPEPRPSTGCAGRRGLLEDLHRRPRPGPSPTGRSGTSVSKIYGPGDTLIVWKIDRLGRNLRDLIDIVTTLQKRGVGVRSLTNGIVDTTTAHGALVFGVFALMAEYEAALIHERTQTGLAAARARGRRGGCPVCVAAR